MSENNFRCPLCQAPKPVQYTKKGKPYLSCDECGVQLFVRYKEGIQRLGELAGKNLSQIGGYVICHSCQVAVKRSRSKVRRPLIGEAGLYCPECERLLVQAPGEEQ